MTRLLRSTALIAALMAAGAAQAQTTTTEVYLNGTNMSVALGPGMSANPFANRGTAESLASIIDAPSASAFEKHNQQTHVWVSGGTLALAFDLRDEYNLSTFHFWNYHSEAYDVDDIDLTFYDGANQLVGTLLDVKPSLGGTSQNDATEIYAENSVLAFPAKVRYVSAVLSGSNGQVDFNNMGFTGVLTSTVPVPEPGTYALMALGLVAIGALRRRQRA